MERLTIQAIKDWNRFYRANFMNCLSGFKSASLIGTINKEGIPNLALFSNIVHIGADPAIIGFINRPIDAAPHTLTNIIATGSYTINHIHSSFIEKAHQTSAKYPEEVDEFVATGLNKEWKSGIAAPFVAESNIKYAMELSEVIPIKQNGTFLVIGMVKEVFLPKNIIQPDGCLAIEVAGSLTSLGINSYYNANLVAKLPYAKP